MISWVSPDALLALGLSGLLATTPAAALETRAFSPCAGSGVGSFLANAQGNVAAGARASVLGGLDNTVCDDDSTIGAGAQNVINSGNGTGTLSFIGGGVSNTIASSQSFIGAGTGNTITASMGAAIVAGTNNTILDSPQSFIGGGAGNSIRGAGSATIFGGEKNSVAAAYGTIVGGDGNTIYAKKLGGGEYGFIGGGYENTVTGQSAVVLGGAGNIASGYAAAVAGGYHNLAAGNLSFAAGFGAYALTDGSFVWADYSPTAPHLASTKANQFLVRATGGVTFYSNGPSTTGVTLAPGGGAWSSASDRALKDAVVPIEGSRILERIAQLPVSQWSYISEPGVRHAGPMAQDFRTAFGVGEDDRHIATIDEGGVSLAALRALAAEGAALQAQAGSPRPAAASCSGSGPNAFLANAATNVAAGAQASVAGGTTNRVCDDDSTVGGGSQNIIQSGNDSAQDSFVGAGSSNAIASGATGKDTFVGGGSANLITAGYWPAIVGGSQNSVQSPYGFIGAGYLNALYPNANYPTIGGGEGNAISGGAFQNAQSVIAGGYGNSIPVASLNAVGGGFENTANGNQYYDGNSVIAGGVRNDAPGEFATIPGGYRNIAGLYGFAGGSRANASADESFVWADDSPGAPPAAATAGEFLVRASGGSTIFSNAAQTTGVVLAAGGGSWASASDRALKTGVARVDAARVLANVARLPVTEWSYRAEPGVRHIGPMAQDFYAAFHLGEDDRHITTIDEDGIVLAAVKALWAEDRSLAAEIRLIKSERSLR